MRFVLRFLAPAAMLAASALAAEISGGVGFGLSDKVTVQSLTKIDSTRTILLDAAHTIIGLGPFKLQGDLPLMLGGSRQFTLQAVSSATEFRAERVQWAVTPGLKGRFDLGLLSPWASFGTGAARMEQGTVISALGIAGLPSFTTRWALAMSPAVGLDVRPLPLVFFRAEARSYVYKQPTSTLSALASSPTDWHNNMVYAVSVGVRF